MELKILDILYSDHLFYFACVMDWKYYPEGLDFCEPM